MEELYYWLEGEPSHHRCEIRYLGESDYGGPESMEPRWEVTVWSQRDDGTKYKEPGVGIGSTLQWAVFRAMTAYFEAPR